MGAGTKPEGGGVSGESNGTLLKKLEGCPIAPPLRQKGSAPIGTHTESIREAASADAERSSGELERMRAEAFGMWD